MRAPILLAIVLAAPVSAVRLLRVPAYAPLKRIIDFVVATTVLLLLSPLLAVVAIAVKATSPGPVIYRARRAGLGNNPIAVCKFRTMVEHADRSGTITVGEDQRITRLGRTLRRTKIDELPQLWNIVRGDMSLIGPRPESLNVVDTYYTREDRELLAVRPGLTSPGTLLYYVYHEHVPLAATADHGVEEYYARHFLRPRLLADLHYLRHRSFAYDLVLVLQTVKIMAVSMAGGTANFEPKFASPPPPSWRTGGPT